MLFWQNQRKNHKLETKLKHHRLFENWQKITTSTWASSRQQARAVRSQRTMSRSSWPGRLLLLLQFHQQFKSRMDLRLLLLLLNRLNVSWRTFSSLIIFRNACSNSSSVDWWFSNWATWSYRKGHAEVYDWSTEDPTFRIQRRVWRHQSCWAPQSAEASCRRVRNQVELHAVYYQSRFLFRYLILLNSRLSLSLYQKVQFWTRRCLQTEVKLFITKITTSDLQLIHLTDSSFLTSNKSKIFPSWKLHKSSIVFIKLVLVINMLS